MENVRRYLTPEQRAQADRALADMDKLIAEMRITRIAFDVREALKDVPLYVKAGPGPSDG